jgi:hypothetical protein
MPTSPRKHSKTPMQTKRKTVNASDVDLDGDFRYGKLYDLCLNTPDRKYFEFFDCFYRFSLPVIYWYWAAITTPIDFFIFTVRHNLLWYGNFVGVLLTCCYLFTPWAMMFIELCKKIEKAITAKKDWSSAGAGAVFFVEPEGFLSSLLWASYKSISMYVGLYLACGNDAEAVKHSWYDHETTKHFWREIMEGAGMRMPRQMGQSGKDDVLRVDHPLDCDMVLKVVDSYLGIGDLFLDHGKDFNTQEDVEKLITDHTYDDGGKEGSYAGKDVLLLELVRPDKDHGVHSFDILTVITPDGSAKVLSCLYWGDCTTSSSHSTRAGYTVDIDSETLRDSVKWYSPFFVKMDPKQAGESVPGIKEACARACKAHEEGFKRLPFLKMVGWDSMIMKNKEMVFFEGNFAGARIPRRMFLGYENLVEFAFKHNFLNSLIKKVGYGIAQRSKQD